MRASSTTTADTSPDEAAATASPEEPKKTPPAMLYGTAWKKERTTALVVQAITAGFRGIDTACQPKHYREDLVGEALRILEETRGVKRSELWVQTKFTPLPGQDPANVPYDAAAPLETQVEQSIQRSLENLGGSIDSLVLHSPLRTLDETRRVWSKFEEAVDAGTVGQLGVSNCYDLRTFKAVYEHARHKPRVLQNRFYDRSGFDRELRAFCLEHDVAYQTFWTLTANGDKLRRGPIADAARRLGVTPPQVLFAWLIRAGHQPLTGTTSEDHMRQDLQAPQLAGDLKDAEVDAIAALF